MRRFFRRKPKPKIEKVSETEARVAMQRFLTKCRFLDAIDWLSDDEKAALSNEGRDWLIGVLKDYMQS